MMVNLEKLGIDPNPKWELTKPGVLVLPGTKYEIRYEADYLGLGPWFVYYHDKKVIGFDATIESVKYSVKLHMARLLEKGLEP